MPQTRQKWFQAVRVPSWSVASVSSEPISRNCSGATYPWMKPDL